MSTLGQKQTYAVRNGMSALSPKADICSALAHVCQGPVAEFHACRTFVCERNGPPVQYAAILRSIELDAC